MMREGTLEKVAQRKMAASRKLYTYCTVYGYLWQFAVEEGGWGIGLGARGIGASFFGIENEMD